MIRFGMTQRTLYFLTLSLLSLLLACTPTGETFDQQGIVKSENDQRQYRYLTLANQLRVLLISDASTDKAAASLDVNVGSGQDPQNYQGLAHFLEHMLFLGTEKYPSADEYQAFITAHGGSHNAYTSFEHTNYFFDIDPNHFPEALDRFAQFFIAPLFTEKYVAREKNAVHSEYTSRIKDDARKSLDVFKSVIEQSHPFAKLSVGNLETLSGGNKEPDDKALRQALLKFHKENYSANIMTLVVLSDQSLDDLEKQVNKRFSKIQNSKREIEPITEPLIHDDRLPLTLYIKPEKSFRTLNIAFPTRDSRAYYRQKPLHYLSNILGHEGGGSLLSYLKGNGWAEGLGAGLGISYNDGAMFNVSVQLTETGLSHVDDIVTAVFQAINRIKATPAREWLYEEQKSVAAQSFRYQQKVSPARYVMRLSSDMHYYPARDVLQAAYLMADYDIELIDDFLSDLRPETSLITVTAPTVPVDKVSPFYHAEYSLVATDKGSLKDWKNARLNPEITLPKPNSFIADDLSLVTNKISDQPPELIQDQSGVRLWFKSIDRFKSPRGSVYFNFKSPLAGESAENDAKTALLAALLIDELNEFSYAARLAGMSYSLRSHAQGVTISIGGFTQKQKHLLEKILATIKSPMFNAERFANIKREHIRSLKNASKAQPARMVMAQLADIVYRDGRTDSDMLEVYPSITLDQLKLHRNNLMAAGSVDMLVYGNYQRETAIEYSQLVAATLVNEEAPGRTVDVVKLPSTPYKNKRDSDYADSSLALYFQAESTGKDSRAAMGITGQMLRSDFYNSLRTEKQLGYIVNSGAYPLREVPGLIFLIQSPVASAQQLHREVMTFLQERLEQLEEIELSEYKKYKTALLVRLEEEPQNQAQQANRYWSDLRTGYYQFDAKEQLAKAIKALTLDQWKAFFVADVIENQRQLAVYTDGDFSDLEEIPGETIEQLDTFKSSAAYYQFE